MRFVIKGATPFALFALLLFALPLLFTLAALEAETTFRAKPIIIINYSNQP